MVKTRKGQQVKAGERTGVLIEQTALAPEDKDINDWFDTARSPEALRENDDEAVEEKTNVVKNALAKSPTRKKVKTPKTGVDMKLPEGESEEGSDVEELSRDRDTSANVSTEAKNYVKKLKRLRTGSRSVLASPSDLSRVSTAPPSPHTEEKKGEDGDDSEIEKPLLTQEGEEETEVAVEDHAAHQRLSKENNEQIEAASPEDNFPVAGDNDDDDNDFGDDLGPPVLEDDSSEDMEGAQAADAAKKTTNEIGGLDSDNDDDDDDGPGFNMVHDPETPDAIRAERARKEKDKLVQQREKKKRKRRKTDTDSEATEDDSSKITPKPKKGKKQKKNKRGVVFSPQGIPIANRDYQTVPIGALVEGSPDEHGPRRSRRARLKPLEFWRGEKMEFGAHGEDGDLAEIFGDMPVVTGVQKALPTPYRKRKPAANKNDAKGRNRKKSAVSSRREREQDEEFDVRKLPKGHKIISGEEAYLWDDATDDTADQKVVAYAADMEGCELPVAKSRKKSEGSVTGKAAQAFNIPNDDNDEYVGYIMGNLVLPPKGIKDSESVGPCAQTFTVCHCQSKALEIAYGDPDQPDGELEPHSAQRFLLGPGDLFRVPPGNSYRLQNHSETTECLLTWTIIRPRSAPSVSS